MIIKDRPNIYSTRPIVNKTKMLIMENKEAGFGRLLTLYQIPIPTNKHPNLEDEIE